jgi:hypothetical protein
MKGLQVQWTVHSIFCASRPPLPIWYPQKIRAHKKYRNTFQLFITLIYKSWLDLFYTREFLFIYIIDSLKFLIWLLNLFEKKIEKGNLKKYYVIDPQNIFYVPEASITHLPVRGRFLICSVYRAVK